MAMNGGRMSEQNSDLRSPVGIYILAVLFLVAPLGNIFFSFAGSGVANWYYPNVFLSLLSTIPVVDWMWLIGIFVAGVALLLRHKLAWMIAVASLFVVLIMNTYRAFTLDETLMTTDFVRMQILISILVTFSVLIIAFYARYPYLDRRQQWMYQTAHRFDAETSVMVHFSGHTMKGRTNSLSTAGARIVFERPSEVLKKETDVDMTLTEIDNMKIHTEVVEYSGNTLRVRFKDFGWSQRAQLEAWLKSRKA
jgi:lysylphosphatidylglycerol synthetase-like protein (DUF2156 family)